MSLLLFYGEEALPPLTEVAHWAGFKGDALPAFAENDIAVVATSNGGGNATAPDLIPGWTGLGTVAEATSGNEIAGRVQAKVLTSGDSTNGAAVGTRVAGVILRGGVIGAGQTLADLFSVGTNHAAGQQDVPFAAVPALDRQIIIGFIATRSDIDLAMPPALTRRAVKNTDNPPHIAVGTATSTQFTAQNATQPATAFGSITFSIGVRNGG